MSYKISITENLNDIDRAIISTLYLPVIKSLAFNIYMFLYDSFNNNYLKIVNDKTILSYFNINEDKFKVQIKLLSAIGLIKILEHSENKKIIICIKRPMTFESIKNNTLFKSLIIKEIGTINFDNIMENNNNNLVNSNYNDVSTSFIEIFSPIPVEKTEISNPIEDLNAISFYKYLTKASASKSIRNSIEFALENGMNNRGINLIINYTNNSKGRINKNYFSTIISDFIKQEIISFEQIQYEIENIISSINNKILKDKSNNEPIGDVLGLLNSLGQ
ncbi:MAG: hypothetical protein K4H23_03960 [Mollicutes bacterium PWAP]|nr:hypothetical protein [Mollicutes bacterium PWAP]